MRAELPNGGVWRTMTPKDVASVIGIAARVHLDRQADDAVFAERQRLYPEGCAVLDIGGRDLAYSITHPWRYGEPPALNAMLGEIPSDPTTYYIYDIAMLQQTRGEGAATVIVKAIIAHAKDAGFSNISLVSMNNSGGFWERFGFEAANAPALEKKLQTYDDHARFMVLRLA